MGLVYFCAALGVNIYAAFIASEWACGGAGYSGAPSRKTACTIRWGPRLCITPDVCAVGYTCCGCILVFTDCSEESESFNDCV